MRILSEHPRSCEAAGTACRRGSGPALGVVRRCHISKDRATPILPLLHVPCGISSLLDRSVSLPGLVVCDVPSPSGECGSAGSVASEGGHAGPLSSGRDGKHVRAPGHSQPYHQVRA